MNRFSEEALNYLEYDMEQACAEQLRSIVLAGQPAPLRGPTNLIADEDADLGVLQGKRIFAHRVECGHPLLARKVYYAIYQRLDDNSGWLMLVIWPIDKYELKKDHLKLQNTAPPGALSPQ